MSRLLRPVGCAAVVAVSPDGGVVGRSVRNVIIRILESPFAGDATAMGMFYDFGFGRLLARHARGMGISSDGRFQGDILIIKNSHLVGNELASFVSLLSS